MKFQSGLIALANECCLADCYIEAAARYNSITLTDIEKIKILLTARDKGYISQDGFVYNPVALMKLTVPGTNYTVRKTSFNESRGQYAAVRYVYNGKGHWVLFGVLTGMLYNGLDFSNCVTNGIPDFNDIRDIVML